MKTIIKNLLYSVGFEIKRLPGKADDIPVGRMDLLLKGLKTRGLNCKTIMDVGANRTEWSRMAKKVFPVADFCLIEPQAEMKDNLDAFCREFKGSAYFLAGAGSKAGQLNLTVWDDLVGSSFLVKPDQHLERKGKQRSIQIITIDELITTSETAIPEIIKLDIQGFELEALKGATLTFGVTEVYIMEVSLFKFGDLEGIPLFADVVNFMLERGYVVYDFPGFLRRPLDGALGQCDICFVKEKGFLRSSNLWE